MVEAHAVDDAGTTVVPDRGEGVEAKPRHHRNLIRGHRALAVFGVIRPGRGLRRSAVAAQIRQVAPGTLEARPVGRPVPSEFALREVKITAPSPGQILVANEYLSVDPYMRGRMSAKKSYIEPYEVGEPMDSPAIGRVLQSNAEGFAPGDRSPWPRLA